MTDRISAVLLDRAQQKITEGLPAVAANELSQALLASTERDEFRLFGKSLVLLRVAERQAGVATRLSFEDVHKLLLTVYPGRVRATLAAGALADALRDFPDEAEAHARWAWARADEVKIFNRMQILMALADVLERNAKIDEAVELLADFAKHRLFETIPTKSRASLLCTLADLLLSKGDLMTARSCAERARISLQLDGVSIRSGVMTYAMQLLERTGGA